MKKVRLSDHAREDLDEIWLSIAVDNVTAADGLIDRLETLLQRLLQFPDMGASRDEIRPGVRSFPCGNYLVFYRSMDYGIAVVRVVWGGRDLKALEHPPE